MANNFLFRVTLAVLIVSTGWLTARAELTDGLVGYWPLDALDPSDASGNGLDGTINGDLTTAEDRLGNPEGAILFPGVEGTHIDLGDHPAFQISGAMSNRRAGSADNREAVGTA